MGVLGIPPRHRPALATPQHPLPALAGCPGQSLRVLLPESSSPAPRGRRAPHQPAPALLCGAGGWRPRPETAPRPGAGRGVSVTGNRSFATVKGPGNGGRPPLCTGSRLPSAPGARPVRGAAVRAGAGRCGAAARGERGVRRLRSPGGSIGSALPLPLPPPPPPPRTTWLRQQPGLTPLGGAGSGSFLGGPQERRVSASGRKITFRSGHSPSVMSHGKNHPFPGSVLFRP